MTNIYDPAIDPYVAQPDNLAVNGSFEVGYSFSPWTTHYTGTIPTMLVFDRSANKLYGDHAVILESNGGLSAYIKSPKIQATPGDILYACCTGYISGPGNGGIHMFAGLSESVRGDFTTILPDVHENFVSTLFTASDAGDGTHVVIEYLGTSGYTIFDGIMVLNLTTYYGAGNEPSKATIDNNIATMAAPPINTGRFWVSTPSAPRDLSATFQTNIKEVTLEWDPPAVSGESGDITYDVYYKLSTDGSYTYWTNTDALTWTGTTPSFNASTNYDFKVTTINSTYGTGESATVTQTTPVGPIAPSIPLLQNVFSTHMYVQVKRNAFDSTIPGVTHYEVYRDTVAGGSYPYVGIITPFSDPQAVLLDQPGAGTFYYKLARVGAWGAGAMSGYETITTPANPSAVGSLAGSFASGAKTVTLTWSVPTTPFGFPVLNYRIEKTGGNGSYIEYSATNSYTHTDSSNEFVSGQSHRFTVSATNNNDTYGPEVYIDLTAPVTNIPSLISTGGFLPNAKTITIDWAAPSTGATPTGYRLFVSGVDITRQQWGGVITGLFGTVTSALFVPKNYTYTFEVSTISVWGESSSTISCTANTPTPPPPNCTGSTASAISGVGSINVVWTFTNSLGMTGADALPIEIERRVTELNGTIIADWGAISSQGIAVTNFTDSGLLVGKIYHYRVYFQSSAWGNSSTGIETNCHSPGLPGPLYDCYAFQDSDPEGNALPLNWKGPVDSGYIGATMTWIIRRQTAAEESLNTWTVVTLSGFGGNANQWYGTDEVAKNWSTAYRYNIVGNNGMGVTEATTNYITTYAGPPAPTKIGVSMEVYRNLPYIRLEWLPAVGNYSQSFQQYDYSVERTTNIISPSWVVVATNKWNDLSFYDPDIYAGTTYYYRISRGSGTTYSATVSITSTATKPTSMMITPGNYTVGGVTYPWYTRAVLGVSWGGLPYIRWFSVEGDPLAILSSASYKLVGQYAESGKEFVDTNSIKNGVPDYGLSRNTSTTSSYDTDMSHGSYYGSDQRGGYNNCFEAQDLKLGTPYKVRQVLKTVADDTIIGYSNSVEIITYSASKDSFPNIFPNSDLRSGFTDVGGAEDYNIGSIRRIDDSTTTEEDLASLGYDSNFKTGKYLSLNKSYNAVEHANLCAYSAVFKLPSTAGFGTRRYYVNANMRSLLAESCTVQRTDIIGDYTTLSSVLEHNSATMTRESTVIPEKSLVSVVMPEQIEFISTGGILASTEGSKIGDVMVVDLTAVFGGNRFNAHNEHYGDIADNTLVISEEDMNKIILDTANDEWWDFDYISNALQPIFVPVVTPIVGTSNVNVGIYSVDDGIITASGTPDILKEGGMDKSGYSPLSNYIFEYRTWREPEFTQINISTTSMQDYYYEYLLEDLEPNTKYYFQYRYTNSAGVVSDPSEYVVYITPPAPPKLSGVSVQRGYIDGKAQLKFIWNTPVLGIDEEDITGYDIYLGTNKNSLTAYEFGVPTSIDGITSQIMGASATSPDTLISANTLYYYRIAAKNVYGAGRRSDLYSIMSTTVPTKPLNLFVEFERDRNTDNVPMVIWDPPASDGGAGNFGSSQDFIGYSLKIAKTIKTEAGPTSYETIPLGDVNEFRAEDYALDKFDTIYMQVAAITNYGTGPYAGPVSVTFAEIEELIRFRGYAETPGKIKLEFSQRESYQQPLDSNGNPMYWIVTGGDATTDIPAGSTLQNIEACIKNSAVGVAGNIYAVSTADTGETENGKKGWPIFVNTGSVATYIGTDLLGEYLDVAVYMYPYRPENDSDAVDDLYDIYTSNIGVNGNEGLTGLNTLMIVSDYTTDISFRDDDTQVILSADDGWLQFRIDAAIVSSNRFYNENVPQTSKVFKIPIDTDYTLDNVKERIANYPVPISDTGTVYVGLEGQINQFFLEDPVLSLIYTKHPIIDDTDNMYDINPFTVTCTYYNEPETDKRHLKINIKGVNEGVEAQISAKTTGVSNMITVTKPNTYLVKENTYELRSFEDMYGRNKPGSSTVNSTYVRRSYGFKFDLDYITGYQEVEKANIDVTPIPGLSSAFNIGIDAQGTTRTITIDGTRVDNSNIWMFHCPYEYQLNQFEGDPAVEEGGVIYTGTSNWGWTKFMKALLGTFQFIDGPYRLVIMTVPSSSMSQYVLDRNCKYQYVDGTYIIKAGYEDMCYVMIDQFQTTRTDGKYNAIDYQLILKRVTPLGSAP